MTSKLRAVAENRFAAISRREDAAMSFIEEERLAVQEKTARLKALRLSTEAESIQTHTAELSIRRRGVSN